MIVAQPQEFARLWPKLEPSSGPFTMRAALLIQDPSFTVVADTGDDNRYLDLVTQVDPQRALAQQLEVQQTLLRCGVPAVVFPALPQAHDGIFCNNAFAAVTRRLILGSMRHPVRQQEPRRADVHAFFSGVMGYEIRDLAEAGGVAELTGPLVIDHRRRLGFCGMSSRVDETGCEAMHEAFGLALSFRFDLAAGEYHTNVVLAILAGRACVLHAPSLADAEAARAIAQAYPDATLLLSDEEKAAFAGNCLAVTEGDVMLSATAFAALRDESHTFFQRMGFRLHAVAVDELEKAGGSLRCIVGEIF